MTALTAKEVIALNNLPKFVPALAADLTDATPLALGDRVQQALSGGAVNLKASAASTVVADAVATAVANATDLATSEALANDLKTKYNAAVTLLNDLKAKYNALAAAINAL